MTDRKSAVPQLFEGLSVIDCDAHWTEPSDLWVSRAPKSLVDKMPVQRTVDGLTAWWFEGELWGTIGGNVIDRNHNKFHDSQTLQPFENVDPSSWAVKERLELLDEIGIFAQTLYPNGMGSNKVFAMEDRALANTIMRIYNDFLVETQHESGGRLFPQAVLPIYDMDETIKEMTRLLDEGITGFSLTDKPVLNGLPELNEPYWAPMWDLFDESGAVANFHINPVRPSDRKTLAQRSQTAGGPQWTPVGGDKADTSPDTVEPQMSFADMGWKTFAPQRYMALLLSQSPLSNMRIICNLVMSDLFDHYPKLKIMSAESGVGWIPFALQSLEYAIDENISFEHELRYQKRRPTEYFRDHIYATFWFEKVSQQLLDQIGVRNVMVETDIPHSTCLYPDPLGSFANRMGDLDSSTIRRVMQDNAAEVFGIELP